METSASFEARSAPSLYPANTVAFGTIRTISGLVFDPIELLERLAALTPRSRINLVLYYGVLGARAAWRPRLGAPEIPAGARDVAEQDSGAEQRAASKTPERPRRNRLWAELMQHSFVFDPGVPAARAVRGGVGVCWPARAAAGVCG